MADFTKIPCSWYFTPNHSSAVAVLRDHSSGCFAPRTSSEVADAGDVHNGLSIFLIKSMHAENYADYSTYTIYGNVHVRMCEWAYIFLADKL